MGRTTAKTALRIASRGKTERSAICNVRSEFYRQYSGMWLGDSQACPRDSHGCQQPTPVTHPIPSSCSLVSRRIDAPRRKWRQPSSRVLCSILDTFRTACVRGRRCPPSAPYRPGTMRLISCRGTPRPWLLFAQVNHKYYKRVSESQWRRSVVKYGVNPSEVKPSNCFRLQATSVISKHSTIPVPDSLYCLEKLVLPSIFHSRRCETCIVIQQQFGMKECDIIIIIIYNVLI